MVRARASIAGVAQWWTVCLTIAGHRGIGVVLVRLDLVAIGVGQGIDGRADDGRVSKLTTSVSADMANWVSASK